MSLINITRYYQMNWLVWEFWKVLYNRIPVQWCSLYDLVPAVFFNNVCPIYFLDLFTFMHIAEESLFAPMYVTYIYTFIW